MNAIPAPRRSSLTWRAVLRDPHVALALGVVAALGLEYVYLEQNHQAHVSLVQTVPVGLALFYAWRWQDRLRLPLVLGLTFVLELGYTLIHIATGTHGDFDALNVYSPQGQSLLDGDYPRSEYPLGAVLIFAFEALLGDGNAERSNAFLMIPFELLLVASVWHVSRRYGPWLATGLAVLPVNLYFWEYRFDLVPASLLALGLVLALRQRWGWCGVALALGAFVKWTPWLALLALAVWLVAQGRPRDVGRLLLGSVAVVLVHVPFAVLAGNDLAAAYTRQGSREITGESIWFPLLHALGVVEPPLEFWKSAGAPRSASVAAAVIQILILVAILVLAWRVSRITTAVALAGMMPVAFLLTNRIFSPQFAIMFLVGWAVAVALLATNRTEQLLVGLGMAVAAILNVMVYPHQIAWEASSVAFFSVTITVTAWVFLRAWTSERAAESVPPQV